MFWPPVEFPLSMNKCCQWKLHWFCTSRGLDAEGAKNPSSYFTSEKNTLKTILTIYFEPFSCVCSEHRKTLDTHRDSHAWRGKESSNDSVCCKLETMRNLWSVRLELSLTPSDEVPRRKLYCPHFPLLTSEHFILDLPEEKSDSWRGGRFTQRPGELILPPRAAETSYLLWHDIWLSLTRDDHETLLLLNNLWHSFRSESHNQTVYQRKFAF